MDIHHAWCYTVGVVIETWESESEMKRQHTPGPWRIGDAGNTVFGPKTDRPSPQTIATLSVIDHEANGRLITAAPELLIAARAALDQIGICCSDTNNKNWHAKGCAVPMLRAAVLRAEGK